ncbi:hypothetical protein DIPPA_20158 [Diplonema papillatum]|nr:hypothetical protein DIPPA_20158 [Diplonema papillatum]
MASAVDRVASLGGAFLEDNPSLGKVHDTNRTELTLRAYGGETVVAKRFRIVASAVDRVASLGGAFLEDNPSLGKVHDTNRTELTLRAYGGETVVAKRFRMCDEEALNRFDA